MPCWYYEKKELRNTPSFRDGIAAEVEARYRREGARVIIDSGTKMGLRYDTCATGVVYFHRFYMFHSFRQFHRYVTATCCLFLAGKVEETPKKCRDILKTVRSMLTESQFSVFGNDPREEVMTLERILLQTIKFDLMVEHPYSCLLKFAKKLKGDPKKMERLVQMSWTFVNDSLCTNLCLQWESDIIAVALMYLGSRLTKVDLNDWEGKVPGGKVKWYDSLVPDVTLDIIEDVCHHVLDLYSKTKETKKEDSPPPPPPPPKPASSSSAGHTPSKRSRSPSPTKPAKKTSRHGSPARPSPATVAPPPAAGAGSTTTPPPATTATTAAAQQQGKNAAQTNATNPYMSSTMFSSSFMSGEGSNTIQTLIGGRGAPPPKAAKAANQYAAGQAGAGPQQYGQSQYPAPPSGPNQQSQYPANPQQMGSGYSGQSYAAGGGGAASSSYDAQYSSGQYSQQQQYSQYPQQQQYPSQQQQQYPSQQGASASNPAQYGSSQQPPPKQQAPYVGGGGGGAQDAAQYNAPQSQQGVPYNTYGGDRSYAQAVSGGGGGGGGGGYAQNNYAQGAASQAASYGQGYGQQVPPHQGGGGGGGGGYAHAQYPGGQAGGGGGGRNHQGQHQQNTGPGGGGTGQRMSGQRHRRL